MAGTGDIAEVSKASIRQRDRSYLATSTQDAFLEALKKRRLNVSAACRSIGLGSTSAVYEQRKVDPEFAARWLEVEQEILDALEEKQLEAAEKGNEDRRWVLSRRRPSRWSERSAHLFKAQIEHRVTVEELSREELLRIVAEGEASGAEK